MYLAFPAQMREIAEALPEAKAPNVKPSRKVRSHLSGAELVRGKEPS